MRAFKYGVKKTKPPSKRTAPKPKPIIYFHGTPEINSIDIPVKAIKIKLFVSGCLKRIPAIIASIIISGNIPNLKSFTLAFAQDSQAAK